MHNFTHTHWYAANTHIVIDHLSLIPDISHFSHLARSAVPVGPPPRSTLLYAMYQDNAKSRVDTILASPRPYSCEPCCTPIEPLLTPHPVALAPLHKLFLPSCTRSHISSRPLPREVHVPAPGRYQAGVTGARVHVPVAP